MPSFEGENKNQRTKSGLNNDNGVTIYVVDHQVVILVLVSEVLNRNFTPVWLTGIYAFFAYF